MNLLIDLENLLTAATIQVFDNFLSSSFAEKLDHFLFNI